MEAARQRALLLCVTRAVSPRVGAILEALVLNSLLSAGNLSTVLGTQDIKMAALVVITIGKCLCQGTLDDTWHNSTTSLRKAYFSQLWRN